MARESMRIVTGCRTPAQFVAVFERFCDAKTCFIPTTDTRPVGSALSFTLRLADGTPMLSGTCVVKATWSTRDNAFKRPGVQLEIDKLSSDSEALFEQMLSRKTIPMKRPVERKSTERIVKLDPAKKRAPGSAFVLPASPLANVDDSALDAMLGCTLADDGEPLPEDDLAIPGTPPPRVLATVLGVAPLEKVKTKPKTKTVPMPVILRSDAVPFSITQTGGTAPLAFAMRPPAEPSMIRLHAMTGEERFWYLCALGAALFIALLVLATTFVFA
ncbi:MAG: hypothetical protein M4D80_36485 [Myxococcota bacterium]|nr:hypothetical protein [Deltaproteobacteria bacterium]MDQ3340689.1 hypothetical protein [Myxococcota bacterium]